MQGVEHAAGPLVCLRFHVCIAPAPSKLLHEPYPEKPTPGPPKGCCCGHFTRPATFQIAGHVTPDGILCATDNMENVRTTLVWSVSTENEPTWSKTSLQTC